MKINIKLNITKNVFSDLAIIMMGFGALVGIAFPFFCLSMGVPFEIVISPIYFTYCIIAGILVGCVNILIVYVIVGSRISEFSSKMNAVEYILLKSIHKYNKEKFSFEKFKMEILTTDALGKASQGFNNMLKTLIDVLGNQSDNREFLEILSNSLEVEVLSDKVLEHILKLSESEGGVILRCCQDEFEIVAAEGIKPDKDKIIEGFKICKELFGEIEEVRIFKSNQVLNNLFAFDAEKILCLPIVRQNTVMGLVILASEYNYSDEVVEKIKFLTQTFAIAFENAAIHKELQIQAGSDPLTGIYNRRSGGLRLEEEFYRSMHFGEELGLIIIDIDYFKTINDTFGHQQGDKVLVSIAEILNSTIRKEDIAIRYGGDEFMCVFPGEAEGDLLITADRIRNSIENNILDYEGHPIKVTVSIGLANYPSKNIFNVCDFIKLADDALYSAKANGRNNICKITG